MARARPALYQRAIYRWAGTPKANESRRANRPRQRSHARSEEKRLPPDALIIFFPILGIITWTLSREIACPGQPRHFTYRLPCTRVPQPSVSSEQSVPRRSTALDLQRSSGPTLPSAQSINAISNIMNEKAQDVTAPARTFMSTSAPAPPSAINYTAIVDSEGVVHASIS